MSDGYNTKWPTFSSRAANLNINRLKHMLPAYFDNRILNEEKKTKKPQKKR